MVTTKLGAATIPLLGSTFTPKAVANGVNCDTFTASVLALPAPTLLITLPPLSKPALVKLTGVLPVDAMVTPALSTLVSPVVTLPSTPRSIFFANLTVSVSVPSATIPMLSSVSLVVSVTPPTTLTVVPSLRSTLTPLSPANVNGFCTSVFNASIAPPTLSKVLFTTV